jgi:hypothetical protein
VLASSVTVDDQRIINETVLKKGELIEVDVKNKKELIIEGYYVSALNPVSIHSVLDKNRLIRAFALDFINI